MNYTKKKLLLNRHFHGFVVGEQWVICSTGLWYKVAGSFKCVLNNTNDTKAYT